MIRTPSTIVGFRAFCRIRCLGLAVLIGAVGASGCGEKEPPVSPPYAATVTVTPATAEFNALGATVQLTARVYDQHGQAMAGAAVTWSSGSAGIATVSAAGLVTAARNGTTTITATSGSASGSATATVAQVVAEVRVSPGLLVLEVGDTARLGAAGLDARGNEVSDIGFEWSSSDTTVATVDGSGLVRGFRLGAVTVAAASEDLRDSAQVGVLSRDPVDNHAAVTAGLPDRPFVNETVGGTEGSTETVGTLRMALNPDVFPVIVSQDDMTTAVLVAGSTLGEGRVVAFPGQDFLSSGDRATLLGNASADRLLANAVRWAGAKRAPPLRVLVDNQRIADVLAGAGFEEVEVVGSGSSNVRNWSADALADMDVAVVQTNEWGTAHLVEQSVAPLRTFAESGGGLVVGASALHWSWWIKQRHGPPTANVLLRGTGISWNEDSIDEIESATTAFDVEDLSPAVIWDAYVGGEGLGADKLALLPPLFEGALEFGRTEELDRALTRLVRETPALPTSSAAPEARLAAETGQTLGPYEWPEIHPWAAVFPGEPAAGARRVDANVTVDAAWSGFPADGSRYERHLALGFYAPPSALVTIEVPAEHATGDLHISVGELHDDLDRAALPIWERAPRLRRTFPLANRRTGITNAYGGSIALVVPADYTGTIPVTVRGAIPMAVYTAGESDAAGWHTALDAGAPQAIIRKPGALRFVISTENARGITDPGEVSAFWDGFQQHHAELAGGPPTGIAENIWIFDPQVGYGYANAGWPRINYPLHAEVWVLVPGTATGRSWLAALPDEGPTYHVAPPPSDYSPWEHGVDWWLFGHELGHLWQTEDWGSGINYPEIGEVAVNLFTMYTLNTYLFGGGDSTLISSPDPAVSTVDHAALAHLRWPTADLFERLSMYRQLVVEFGWSSMKQVFHSYYDPAYPRSTYGGGLDGFAIRFSAIVQRDPVGFFRHWEYPLSESAAETIRGFGYEDWLPPGW